MQKLAQVAAALGIVVSALFMQGCDVDGTVVIGPPRYDYPPHHRWCGYDRWGRYYCDDYWRYGDYSNGLSTEAAGFVTRDQRAAQVSERYDVSHYASSFVVNAVTRAERGDMSGLTLLGLTRADAETVYNGGRLSQDKLSTVGNKLRMSNDDVETLVAKISRVAHEHQQ